MLQPPGTPLGAVQSQEGMGGGVSTAYSTLAAAESLLEGVLEPGGGALAATPVPTSTGGSPGAGRNASASAAVWCRLNLRRFLRWLESVDQAPSIGIGLVHRDSLTRFSPG